MKEILYKIASLAMAFLVLFSTMSFTVDMHYCGDHLVDFSFSDSTDSCVMKAWMSESPSECATLEMEMDCCTDVEFVLEGQDDLKLSFEQLKAHQQVFVAALVYTYINLYKEMDKKLVHFKDYSPPPLIHDVQVLHQSFLI